MSKQCSRCKQTKPLSEFYRNQTRKDGFDHRCKECCKRHQRKPNSTCGNCGKEFYAAGGSTGQYCSRECSAADRDQKVDRICPICGASFKVHRHHLQDGTGVYCSRTCAMRARIGENCANWKGGPVEKSCEVCGNTYSVKPYRVNSARFCSTKCKGQWQADYFRGENHPLWLGGFSREDYPAEWNEAFRQFIRERDNYTCVVCGEPGADVHHIDYAKENTTPENCVTLCRSCHAKTNFDREYWLVFFQSFALESEDIVND